MSAKLKVREISKVRSIESTIVFAADSGITANIRRNSSSKNSFQTS